MDFFFFFWNELEILFERIEVSTNRQSYTRLTRFRILRVSQMDAFYDLSSRFYSFLTINYFNDEFQEIISIFG